MYGILSLCDIGTLDRGFFSTNYKILYTFLGHTRFVAEILSFGAVISGSAADDSRSAADIFQSSC